MLAWLSLIPGLNIAITSVLTAVFNERVKMLEARTGMTRDVAVTTLQSAAADYHTRATMLGTISANKLLTWLVILFAMPIVLYEWKCVVWDTIWLAGEGTTLPIRGQVAEWMNVIISWLFGSSATLVVAQMFAKRIDNT